MKHGMKYVALTLTIALLLAGCGQKQAANSTSTPSPKSAQTAAPTATPAPTPEPMKTKQVKAYYADNDLTKLIEKTVSVSYKEDADVYKAALEALKTTNETGLNSLFKNVKFNSVKLDGKALRVDLTMGEGAQLGSGGESFFLDALQKTVFQFAEVAELYVTKDGAKVESLMGHMDLKYPFKRP